MDFDQFIKEFLYKFPEKSSKRITMTVNKLCRLTKKRELFWRRRKIAAGNQQLAERRRKEGGLHRKAIISRFKGPEGEEGTQE